MAASPDSSQTGRNPRIPAAQSQSYNCDAIISHDDMITSDDVCYKSSVSRSVHAVAFWNDKVVLITGASSGIGRGLALELARRGARLGLVARRKDLLDEIVAEIEAGNKPNGDRATDVLTIQGDVQSSESMRSAAESLRSRFGKIDMLIANAGIGVTNDAAELDA